MNSGLIPCILMTTRIPSVRLLSSPLINMACLASRQATSFNAASHPLTRRGPVCKQRGEPEGDVRAQPKAFTTDLSSNNSSYYLYHLALSCLCCSSSLSPMSSVRTSRAECHLPEHRERAVVQSSHLQLWVDR